MLSESCRLTAIINANIRRRGYQELCNRCQFLCKVLGSSLKAPSTFECFFFKEDENGRKQV